jgi:hypothetical protein
MQESGYSALTGLTRDDAILSAVRLHQQGEDRFPWRHLLLPLSLTLSKYDPLAEKALVSSHSHLSTRVGGRRKQCGWFTVEVGVGGAGTEYSIRVFPAKFVTY